MHLKSVVEAMLLLSSFWVQLSCKHLACGKHGIYCFLITMFMHRGLKHKKSHLAVA